MAEPESVARKSPSNFRPRRHAADPVHEHADIERRKPIRCRLLDKRGNGGSLDNLGRLVTARRINGSGPLKTDTVALRSSSKP